VLDDAAGASEVQRQKPNSLHRHTNLESISQHPDHNVNGPGRSGRFLTTQGLGRQLQTLSGKFGYILVPTASSLQAQADRAALRTTFSESSVTLSGLVAPAILVLAVFGDPLIRLWMGHEYVYSGLTAVLALGCFPACVQEPAWNILAGMNQHGRLALAKLAGAIGSAVLLAIGLLISSGTCWQRRSVLSCRNF